jgi:predicted RNA polymerase sigma factor
MLLLGLISSQAIDTDATAWLVAVGRGCRLDAWLVAVGRGCRLDAWHVAVGRGLGDAIALLAA